MARIIAICKQRRLYFVPVTDRKGRSVRVIYRERPKDDPREGGIRVDVCRGGDRALLNRLKRAAGIDGDQAPAGPQREEAF